MNDVSNSRLKAASSRGPRLAGFSLRLRGQTIPLDGERLAVGSGRRADRRLSAPSVSRRHAELSRLPDGAWQIADLGSRNGTRVNGARLAPDAPVALRHGDFVYFAQEGYRFDDGRGLPSNGRLAAAGFLLAALLLAAVAAARLWLAPGA